MLIYLDQAYEDHRARGSMKNLGDLTTAVKEGAVQRIRPKMMTVAAILFGLLPIMWSTGSGSEVMKRIAAPIIGGVVTSAILELLLYPIVYVLWRATELRPLADGQLAVPHSHNPKAEFGEPRAPYAS